MFFSKKKKQKLDPKVRFQNRQFNQKLNQARNFKRTAKPIPETEFNKILERIGLGTIWRKILLGIIVAGLIYIVYIPNFLSWQTIRVEGMSDANRAVTEEAIRNGLGDASFYNPQRNLLFLSKQRITEAATGVKAVDEVLSIKRDFKTKTIIVQIQSKYEQFLVRANNNVIDVFNDGFARGQAGISRDSWMTTSNPSMIKIDIPAKINHVDSGEFFTSRTTDYLIQISNALKAVTGSTVQSYKIVPPEFKQPKPLEEPAEAEQVEKKQVDPGEILAEPEDLPEDQVPESRPEPVQEIDLTLPVNADELEIIFQKGNSSDQTFRVIIDTNENYTNVVNRLNLLLSQTAPDRYNGLSYIDLRLPSRAFVCLAGSPCD